MKEGIIPEPLPCFQVNTLKNLEDFLLIEETNEGLLSPLLGDIEDGICHFQLFRILEAEHFGK